MEAPVSFENPAGVGRSEKPFELVSDYEPAGDQPEAIDQLVAGIERGDPHQTLLGVTGSGKTFTIACAVARTNRPALVMSPNKTLAAQLYAERTYWQTDIEVDHSLTTGPR